MPARLSNGQRTAISPEAKLIQGVSANTDLSKRGAGLTRGPKTNGNMVNAPWTNTWPAAGASLDIDFVNDRSFIKSVGTGSAMKNLTYTRASIGTYINRNGVLQTALINQPRIDWLNTPPARNLLTYTGDLTNTNGWNLAATTFSNGCLFETATTSSHTIAQTLLGGGVLNGIFTLSVEVFPNGRDLINIATNPSSSVSSVNYTFSTNTFSSIGTTVLSYSSTILSDGYVRVTLTTNGAGTFIISPSAGGASYLGDITKGVYIRNPQIEYGSVATPYQYIYTNLPLINPLQASSTANGILIEESRANDLLWCRDATNAAWVSTTMTVAKNQTGIDGVANACSSLTATSANGTCIQTVTAVSANKTSSVYLKRITGTGTIQVTMDGTTWITVDLSNGIWNRIVLIATIANPTVGIKIITSGDAVAMDYGQIELNTDCNCATTPILTTTASVTRAADFGMRPIPNIPNYFNFSKGTLYGEGVSLSITKVHVKSLLLYGVGGSNFSNIGFHYDSRTYAQQESTGTGVSVPGKAYAQAFNPAKIAMSYKQGEFNYADNGINSFSTFTTLSSLKPSVNVFYIGCDSNGITFQGYIKRVVYYPFDTNIDKVKDIVSQ